MGRAESAVEGRTGGLSARRAGRRLGATVTVVVALAVAAAVAATTAGAGGAATDPTMAEAAGLAPGTTPVSVVVAGVRRTATVVVPPGTVPGLRPLLVVLHGVGMRGADMRAYGFDPLAAGRGAIVAYPDAWNASWNDGRPGMEPTAPGETADDVAFLRALIGELVSSAGVDPRRVAVAGFSNGAIMTARLACDLGDRVAAVALVAGAGGEGFARTCKPARALPVLVVAGTGDRIVPYGGGQVADFNGSKRGRVASVAEFVDYWERMGGCSSLAETLTGGPDLRVTRIEGRGCARRAGVLHYRLVDAGHDWYRVPGFDTTAAVWDFLAPVLGDARRAVRPWGPDGP